ncbi:alpha-1,3-mannosyl-glycoprotein 2-beta-N-acetylglucosaminyltransferase [Sarracenia purpurea var. burkii]
MVRFSCDFRYLLLAAAVAFIYIQMRLFATQSEYADRLAAAMESENHCTSQMRSLIDQISMQQGRIVALEEKRKRQDQECRQLRALVEDLERKGLEKNLDKVQVPVAAVVVMACNRADYLERTIKSIMQYQSSVASKYPLFVSQDGEDPLVRSKALSYKRLTYMQGSSLGQFFRQYLQPIKLNDVKVDWKSMNLSYLTEGKYTKHFADIVKNTRPIYGTDAVLKAYNIDGDVRIHYKDQEDFERIAHQFGIFQEWKDGVPRTAYKGVVVFRYQTPRRIFLVGPESLQQLGIEHAL